MLRGREQKVLCHLDADDNWRKTVEIIGCSRCYTLCADRVGRDRLERCKPTACRDGCTVKCRDGFTNPSHGEIGTPCKSDENCKGDALCHSGFCAMSGYELIHGCTYRYEDYPYGESCRRSSTCTAMSDPIKIDGRRKDWRDQWVKKSAWDSYKDCRSRCETEDGCEVFAYNGYTKMCALCASETVVQAGSEGWGVYAKRAQFRSAHVESVGGVWLHVDIEEGPYGHLKSGKYSEYWVDGSGQWKYVGRDYRGTYRYTTQLRDDAYTRLQHGPDGERACGGDIDYQYNRQPSHMWQSTWIPALPLCVPE